jgi:hypothetical protein
MLALYFWNGSAAGKMNFCEWYVTACVNMVLQGTDFTQWSEAEIKVCLLQHGLQTTAVWPACLQAAKQLLFCIIADLSCGLHHAIELQQHAFTL